MGIKQTKHFNIIPELKNIEYFDNETKLWKNMENIPRTIMDVYSSEINGLLNMKYSIKPVVFFDTGCFQGSVITENLFQQMNLTKIELKPKHVVEIFERQVIGMCILKFKLFNNHYQIFPYIIDKSESYELYYTLVVGNDFFLNIEKITLLKSRWNTLKDAHQKEKFN